ncbi:MAG: peptidase domain-containing ABC transporter [Synechococcales cyanobacterium RU_4_20]|nr:peptidase domain-containing ABC transporter [Synechococcales cyanobacterium RU_4_20]
MVCPLPAALPHGLSRGAAGLVLRAAVRFGQPADDPGDHRQGDHPNSTDTLQVLGLFLVVVAIFEALLSSLRTYLFVDTTNRIDLALGAEIIDHLFRLPLRYFEKRPVGELSSRVNELENIRQFLTGTALTVVLDSVFSVIYIVVMFVYSWKLTLVALGSIPLFIGVTLIFSPIVRRLLRKKAENYARTQSYLVEALSGIQTVKAQNIELKARWQWQDRYARYVSAGFKTVLTNTIASSTSDFLNKLSALLVLWVGAVLVLNQDITLGQLIAFRIISGYVTGPLLRLAQLWQNFQETALSLERLSDIIDTPQEESEEERNNILMPLVKGNIRYENVSFRFGASGPLQLTNISVDIPAGKFVGIVGQSGSGKSTLTKLLPRLYHPASGRILIDDSTSIRWSSTPCAAKWGSCPRTRCCLRARFRTTSPSPGQMPALRPSSKRPKLPVPMILLWTCPRPTIPRWVNGVRICPGGSGSELRSPAPSYKILAC